MAWTAPRTWVSGEVVSAAQLNQQVRDNMLAIGRRAARTVVTNVDASARATIPFGVTFAAAPVVVASGGNFETVSIVSVSTASFVAEFRYASTGGAIGAGGAVRIHFEACEATS